MGIFDFLKNRGEKIKREKDGKEVTADELNELEVQNELIRLVRNSQLPVDDLHIDFKDGTATVYGKADTQITRERVRLIVGNVNGVARVDDRLKVEKEEPESKMYTVESGDTLSKIAKQFYGDASKYPVIFEANKPMLKDPDRIYPGQVLRIPAA